MHDESRGDWDGFGQKDVVGASTGHLKWGFGMQDIRLICEPAAAGDWNMAVDETLLEGAAGRGGSTLRFYAWQTPTLSLGYFQSLPDRAEHAPSRACPVVRRASGGGAIVHDRELTYAMVVPHCDPRLGNWAREPLRLYQAFHQTLVEVLGEWGIRAEQVACGGETCEASGGPTTRTKGEAPSRGAEPFLCFERRMAGDVVLSGHKIGGSAQRRIGGAVLQHGSVLLARSLAAPELPGIAELSGIGLSVAAVREAWMVRLGVVFSSKFAGEVLAKGERDRAEYWRTKRFGTRDWTSRR